MVRLIEKFDGPVRAIKTLLGDSYEKEYSALSSLCGLIQTYRPRKIIKVGGRNSSATAAVLCCVERLQLPCQLAVVDSYDAVPPYTKDVFDLERELKRRNIETCRIFRKRALASFMDEMGGDVDLLILDAAETAPYDVLDFIAAFPYLASNAIVVHCGSRSSRSYKDILFQNVTADKFSAHFSSCEDLQDYIRFIITDTLSVFQVNRNTSQHIPDVFAALRFPWQCIPTLEHLLEYKKFIDAHYDALCQKLYMQAVLAADPNKKMLKAMADTLLKTFPQVLLYGKGKRGSYFLKLASLIGIPITGFVVSDGRSSERLYENLPVYSYSEIPFPFNNTFIFQISAAEEIGQRLQKSKFHWMNLPDNFWDDFAREDYLFTMMSYLENVFPMASIWAKEGLNR